MCSFCYIISRGTKCSFVPWLVALSDHLDRGMWLQISSQHKYPSLAGAYLSSWHLAGRDGRIRSPRLALQVWGQPWLHKTGSVEKVSFLFLNAQKICGQNSYAFGPRWALWEPVFTGGCTLLTSYIFLFWQLVALFSREDSLLSGMTAKITPSHF